jgi:hypothetical protein
VYLLSLYLLLLLTLYFTILGHSTRPLDVGGFLPEKLRPNAPIATALPHRTLKRL